MTTNYWRDRQSQYFKNLEKNEKKLNEKLDKYYERQSKEIQKQLASYYGQYGRDNMLEYTALLKTLDSDDRRLLMEDMESFFASYPQLEHLREIRKGAYKVSRLEKINYELLKQQAMISDHENELIEQHLKDQARYTMEDMGFSMGVNETMVSELVNEKWLEDKNFSDRIWDSTERVTNFLRRDFKDGVVRGDSYRRIGRQLQERFITQSSHNIKRLIYTEGTFVQNQATSKSFELGGYTSYFYDAVMDDRTTDICQSLHGEEFLFADRSAGVNFPPMHPFCRSSFKVNTKSRYEDEPVVEDEPRYENVNEAFSDFKLNGIDKKFAKDIESRFLDLQNKYPIGKKKTNVVARRAKSYFGQYRYGVTTRTRQGKRYIEYLDEISISNTLLKDEKTAMMRSKRSAKHFKSPITDHLATIDHEYAHAIDNYYALMQNKDMMKLTEKYSKLVRLDSKNVIDEANELNGWIASPDDKLSFEIVEDMRAKYGMNTWEFNKLIDKELGKYASSDNAEFLAEGFAAMRTMEDTDKTDFIRDFEDIFNEKFKGVIEDGND